MLYLLTSSTKNEFYFLWDSRENKRSRVFYGLEEIPEKHLGVQTNFTLEELKRDFIVLAKFKEQQTFKWDFPEHFL